MFLFTAAVLLSGGTAHPISCDNGRPAPQGTETDDLYCAVTCSGMSHLSDGQLNPYVTACESALTVTGGFGASLGASTTHLFEYYFDSPTTLGAVDIGKIYNGKSLEVWILVSSMDTSGANYENLAASTANQLAEVSNKETLTGENQQVKILDPTITSRFWAVAVRTLDASEATNWKDMVLRGNHGTAIYGPWGGFSPCACRIQVKTRDCFSTQNGLCSMWPHQDSEECNDCTCNQAARLTCSDSFQVDECSYIFDGNDQTILQFSGVPDVNNGYWRVLFDFREQLDNGTHTWRGDRQTVHIEYIHWVLTDSSNVDSISWTLYKPSDNDNPTDQFRIFAGPSSVKHHDIEWTLAEPVPVSVLVLKFEPTNGATAQIGIKELYVKGFIPENYPNHDCLAWLGPEGAATEGEPEEAETEFPLWVLFALGGCAFIVGILVCFWCFEWACFKRNSGDDKLPSTRDQTSIEMASGTNHSSVWNNVAQDLDKEIGNLRPEGTLRQMRDRSDTLSTTESAHQEEGRITMHNVHGNDPYPMVNRNAEGRPSQLQRGGTDNHVFNNPGGRPSQIVQQIRGRPSQIMQQIDHYNVFINRAGREQIDEAFPMDHTQLDIETARLLLATYRGVAPFEVTSSDLGVKLLSGLNKRQLQSKLRNLTEAGVAALDGPRARNRSSVHDQNLHVAQTVHTVDEEEIPDYGRMGRGLTQASERLPELPGGDDGEWDESPEKGADRSEPLAGVLSTQTTDNRNPNVDPAVGANRIHAVFSEEEKMAEKIGSPGSAPPAYEDSEEGEGEGAAATGAPVRPPSSKVHVSSKDLPKVIFKYKNAKRKWKPNQLKCYVTMTMWLQNNIDDLPADWTLEYIDDGDNIQIASDDDIAEALRDVMKSSESKLYVTVVAG